MDTSAPWRELEAGATERTAENRARARPPTMAIVLAVAVALVLGTVALVATAGMRSGGRVEVVPAGSGASYAASSGPMLVVEVAGAVLRPGVYSLPPGSRVADAIGAAGGYSTDVDPRLAETKLNLAAKLQDAQLVTVPRRGGDASASSAEASGAAAGPINLNTATAGQLDALPGVGPATAAKIIAAREKQAFASVDDLVNRKIVTASVLAKFRELVTVG